MKNSIIALDEKFLTPAQLAARWQLHVESIRRKIRTGEIGSLVIGRRRLIPLEVINKLEINATVN